VMPVVLPWPPRSAGRPGPQHVLPGNNFPIIPDFPTPQRACVPASLRPFWSSSTTLLASLALLVVGCGALVNVRAATFEDHAGNNVRSIILPHFEPELPVAAGRDEYLAVCVSCHSPRYVTMQPLFPQRQW